MGWMMAVVLGLALGSVSVAHIVARMHYDPASAQLNECDSKRPGSRA